jgi:hypothetical protein
MKSWTLELQQRWEDFNKSWEEGPLLKVLREHPEAMIHCEHDYPYLHRVVDVILRGQMHGVLRCTLCHDELTFKPIPADIANSSEGVPHWLRGPKLRRWAEEEAEFPTKGDIDWERFR